jgi:hypothetical protein
MAILVPGEEDNITWPHQNGMYDISKWLKFEEESESVMGFCLIAFYGYN